MAVDLRRVRALTYILKQTGIYEIEVESGDERIKVIRRPPPPAQSVHYEPSIKPDAEDLKMLKDT